MKSKWLNSFTFLIRINLNNINMKKQKESIKVLTELDYETRCSQTKMPKEYVPKKSFSDNTANGLEKCIVLWCKLNGWLCERVKNTGRYIDESKIVTDFMGNTKRIGTGKFIKGTGTNGTADCRAIIKGRSISFEVKIGRDVQSDAQKEYQLNVEKSGGLYFIVKDFDNFIEIYKGIIEGKYEKIQNNNN